MSVLVYGIIDATSPVAAEVGLNQQSLRCVSAGALAAIISDHDGSAPDQTVQALWDYEHAVERLAHRNSVLPARFASVLSDERAVREMLRGRRRQLVAALERIRGAAELALCANWPPPQVDPTPQTGIAYMRGRLEMRSRARELASALEPLGAVSRASRSDLSAVGSVPMRFAYLVDRARLGEFTAVVEQLDRGMPDVELVCTGPWPAYSFAEGARA